MTPDPIALWTLVREHRWTARRLLILSQLMRYAAEVDAMEYGRITFNLGPSTVTPEINAVKPKEHVALESGARPVAGHAGVGRRSGTGGVPDSA